MKRPIVWTCPGCGRKVEQPAELLKDWEACGHRCPKTRRWQDFKKEEQ